MTSVSFIQIILTQQQQQRQPEHKVITTVWYNRTTGERTVVGGVVISQRIHLSAANLLNLLHKEVFHVT